MNDLQKRLVEKRQIGIFDDINKETAKYITEALQELTLAGSPPITVFITSDGGDAQVGLYGYDLLRYYTGHKTGVGRGAVSSAALTIFLGCDWRVVTPGTKMLIHHVKCVGVPLIALKDEVRRNKFLQSREHLLGCYSILAERTGKTEEEILAECDNDEYMSAERAHAYGLIHQIIKTESEIEIPKKE